jgi:hypothetical protein
MRSERLTQIVGALAGAAGAVTVVAMYSIVGTLRLNIAGIHLAFDGQFGFYGVVPAAVAGWILARGTTQSGVAGVISAAARMSLLTVALGLALVLLVAVVNVTIGGPASLGTSRLDLIAFILLLAALYGLLVVGPIFAIALLPLALGWALVVHVLARPFSGPGDRIVG